MPVGIFIPFGCEIKNKLLTGIPARVTQPLPPALGKCRCGSCRSQTASDCCCRPGGRAAAVGVVGGRGAATLGHPVRARRADARRGTVLPSQ
ncbi:hypothetical protein G6F46_015360 [Rhizopus delemar]|nr:hypothetical protein G6F46_015360 [Rhizopus delemar]